MIASEKYPSKAFRSRSAGPGSDKVVIDIYCVNAATVLVGFNRNTVYPHPSTCSAAITGLTVRFHPCVCAERFGIGFGYRPCQAKAQCRTGDDCGQKRCRTEAGCGCISTHSMSFRMLRQTQPAFQPQTGLYGVDVCNDTGSGIDAVNRWRASSRSAASTSAMQSASGRPSLSSTVRRWFLTVCRLTWSASPAEAPLRSASK